MSEVIWQLSVETTLPYLLSVCKVSSPDTWDIVSAQYMLLLLLPLPGFFTPHCHHRGKQISKGKGHFSGATKNLGISHLRMKTLLHLQTLTLNTPASAFESLSTAKKDPEELCWSSGDQLMEKGLFLPLPHCPGRFALIPVRLSESRLSKFILVSIFIVPPQINTAQKH